METLELTNRETSRAYHPADKSLYNERMIANIVSLIPEHRTYVEVFGGAGLLFAKAPSAVEVYNDLDSGLVSFARTLREPGGFVRLFMLAEHNVVQRPPSPDGAYAAEWFLDVVPTVPTDMKQRGGALLLKDILDRAMRVQVEHSAPNHLIRRYDTPETLFFLNPSGISRVSRALLVQQLLRLCGRAILLDLDRVEYQAFAEAGWTRLDYVGGRFGYVTAWINPGKGRVD